MNKKKQQHYIPRVYLKNFQIDDNVNRSFVYCIDFSNKYNSKSQRKGINDKIFKEKKFYNDHRLIDPFAIENILAEEFEPKFENIIKTISKEVSPPKETVEDLMTWLYISKIRSPYLRANSRRLLKWYIDITNSYKGHKPTDDEKKEIEEYVAIKSREVHLNSFSDMRQMEELVKLHVETLNAKHWKILISQPDFPFWTNDNPGFSPNVHPLFAKDFPFHQIMELNSSSIIFYVLTPKYCIEITPFTEGTPLTLCALNMNIKYEQASATLIDFINRGVFYSRYKLLISNSKTLLDNCVKTKD
jgi:hypothetical protein